ncbi:hypothetical protein EDB92DRAFT_2118338 [Lactarius akahatsu]|uniref:RNase III domain-containing protein n=1 Tax=Lactarius akahatsu TaxID=416441 RepID=A0AAD4L828_9AGAM|nr:hypothetical protein EDB92DRAFT_2118338 [Lactarius akahatsu]
MNLRSPPSLFEGMGPIELDLAVDQSWILERWWFKLTHVCQTWRHLILASATGLDLHLVCTYGTPVRTMLTHAPPLPLIMYYPRGLGDGAVMDVLFLLQHRQRLHRIYVGAPAPNLLGLLDLMVGEYPTLLHLVIRSHTEQHSASSRTSVELPAKLQAPLLRHFTLFDIRPPLGSELLLRAEGLVTLDLMDVVDSPEAHPAHLVRQLAHMVQLERLVVHFRTVLPNRTVERTLSDVGSLTALPRLNLLSFHGGSAYLEGVLARISAPSLQALSLNFFAQLTFDLPHLVHFVRTAQEQTFPSLSSTAHARGGGTNFQFHTAELRFEAGTTCVLLDSRARDQSQADSAKTNPVQLHVSCRALDWQLAGLAQICGALAPLFERVERLTLGLYISHPYTNSDSDSDRAQWHVLLRAFGGTKILQLADSGSGRLVRSVLPFTAELLPALQKLRVNGLPLPHIRSRRLLEQIFTHRSLALRPKRSFEDSPDDPSPDNEQLVRIGDQVFSLVVTDLIRDHFPNLRVGPSSKVRDRLKHTATLSRVACLYHLHDCLLVQAAQATEVKGSLNAQAEVFMAYVGGLYREQGMGPVNDFLRPLLYSYVQDAYENIRREHLLPPMQTPRAPTLRSVS